MSLLFQLAVDRQDLGVADKGEGQNGDGVRRLEAKDTEGQQKKTAQHFFKVQQATQGNACLIPDTAVDTAHLSADTTRSVGERVAVNLPRNKHTADNSGKGRRKQCKHVSSSHLRVDGKHFGLALVVRRIDVNVVMKRSLVMMIISERTGNVEPLVDHLGRQQNIGERKDKNRMEEQFRQASHYTAF